MKSSHLITIICFLCLLVLPQNQQDYLYQESAGSPRRRHLWHMSWIHSSDIFKAAPCLAFLSLNLSLDLGCLLIISWTSVLSKLLQGKARKYHRTQQEAFSGRMISIRKKWKISRTMVVCLLIQLPLSENVSCISIWGCQDILKWLIFNSQNENGANFWASKNQNPLWDTMQYLNVLTALR